jgi:hypothetical protein
MVAGRTDSGAEAQLSRAAWKRSVLVMLAALAGVLAGAAPAAAAFDVTPMACGIQLAPSAGVAVFGYHNPEAYAQEVELGSDNLVLESPFIRQGQLSTFAPGWHETAWTSFYNPSDSRRNRVTWFLQGAAASTAGRPCGGEAPVNDAPPTLVGTPAVGQALGIDPGSWSSRGTPIFQWQLEGCDDHACAVLGPPSADAPVVPAAAAGLRLRARVFAPTARGMGIAVTALTAPLDGTAAPVPDPSPPDTSGVSEFTPQPSVPSLEPATVRAGDPLAADVAWSGKPASTVTVRWQRCAATCTDIAGADGATYAPTAADVGARVRSLVTGTGQTDPAIAVFGAVRTTAASASTAVTAPPAHEPPAEQPPAQQPPAQQPPAQQPPAQAPPATPPDRTRPVLRGVKLVRSRFRIASRRVAVAAAARRGTALRLRSSEAAWLRVDVRTSRGRTVATVTRRIRAGASRLTLTGRFRDGHHTVTLRRGRYRLAVQATDAAGNRSRTTTVSFRVTR